MSELKKDLAWKYVCLADPDKKNKNDITCNFCQVITKGGIYRAKQHLAGGYRNSKACKKCPPAVREEIKEYMSRKIKEKRQIHQFLDYDDVDKDKVEEVQDDVRGKRPMEQPSKTAMSKRPRQKGTMDFYMTQVQKQSLKIGRRNKQPSMKPVIRS